MKKLLMCLVIVLVIIIIFNVTCSSESLIEAPINKGPAWMNTTLLAVESSLPQAAPPGQSSHSPYNATLQRRFGMESAGKGAEENFMLQGANGVAYNPLLTKHAENYMVQGANGVAYNPILTKYAENYISSIAGGSAENYIPTAGNNTVYGSFQRPPKLPTLPFMPVTSSIYQQ